MKRTIIIVFLLCFKSIYAQHFTFSIEGVKLEFHYQINEERIIESIKLLNTNESSIYIPVLIDTSLYFFNLQNTVYSYFGIKNSFLGPPNLGGMILLKEVKQGDSVKFNVINLLEEQNIYEYRIAFDYIEKSNIKKKKVERSSIMMKAQDYTLNCKSFFFISNPKEK